jgi:hypothetical protein
MREGARAAVVRKEKESKKDRKKEKEKWKAERNRKISLKRHKEIETQEGNSGERLLQKNAERLKECKKQKKQENLLFHLPQKTEGQSSLIKDAAGHLTRHKVARQFSPEHGEQNRTFCFDVSKLKTEFTVRLASWIPSRFIHVKENRSRSVIKSLCSVRKREEKRNDLAQ